MSLEELPRAIAGHTLDKGIIVYNGIPFFLILAYLPAGGIKNRYNIGKSALFLIFGAGMVHGFLSYLFQL